MDDHAYSVLHDTVLAGRHAMLKMFRPLTDELDKLPNMHLALHLADDARLFSNCLNSSVALDEILHKAPKTLVPHTNFKDIDVAFLKDDNLLQTMRSVLAGGTTEDCPRISRIYTALQHRTPKLFDGYYFGHHVVNVGALDDHSGKVGNLSLEQVDNRFLDIQLYLELSRKERRSRQLIHSLVNCEQPSVKERIRLLRCAYQEWYTIPNPLIAADNISNELRHFEKLIYFDTMLQHKRTIRVGDLVGCNTQGHEGQLVIRTARVDEIFIHAQSSQHRIFLKLTWFKDIGSFSPLMPSVRKYELDRAGLISSIAGIGILSSSRAAHFLPNYRKHKSTDSAISSYLYNPLTVAVA
ncbi:hypothetical protein BT69DRAFT_765451 [Atractiella rhizophila]|nr:hypothetical protein BT69DRAFT_765451 [Atractiella rhizophila]